MATAELQPINGDTRFYPGWMWLYWPKEGPMRGYCVRGTTKDEAIDRWAGFYRKQYWLRGRKLTICVMSGPDDVATAHEITV